MKSVKGILSGSTFIAATLLVNSASGYYVQITGQALSNQNPDSVQYAITENDGPTTLSFDTGVVDSVPSGNARSSTFASLFTGKMTVLAQSSFNQLATGRATIMDSVTVSLPDGVTETSMTASLRIEGAYSGALQGGTNLFQSIRINGTGTGRCSDNNVTEIALRDVVFPTNISTTVTVRAGCTYNIQSSTDGGTGFFAKGPSMVNVANSVTLVVGDGATWTSDSGLFLAGLADDDNDNVIAAEDNCLATANSGQVDADADGYGNVCDADFNNDCVVNVLDLGVLRSVFFSDDANADMNSDGVVNIVDLGLLRQLFFSPPGPSAFDDLCGN